MLPTLTDRQKAIYDFLLKSIREKGFAPSIHEIGRQFKIASTNGAKDVKFAKDYALRDQIRRAVVSIMSNIAAGCERGGNQEFIQFLYVAKASYGDVRSHLYVALDQSYIAQKDCDDVSNHFAVCRS